jgi:hypothetical protein
MNESGEVDLNLYYDGLKNLGEKYENASVEAAQF